MSNDVREPPGSQNSGQYARNLRQPKAVAVPATKVAASRNPTMTEEDAIQLGHDASLEVANAIGAIENWPQMWRGREDKAAASYEFGNGCRITVFVVYREDRYEILGSRYSKSGANLNGDSATIYGLHNVAEMQAAMHTMALELPRRRKG
jgi:hypothetical protein